MEIIKTVNRDTLTPEETEALDGGLKTEEDLLAEHEEVETQKQKEKDEAFEKANKKASDQEIRAKKAEDALKAKEGEKKDETLKNDSLSQTDLIAILKADVAEEDIDVVKDYAKLKNIPVSEALKSSVVKTILSEKNEERKTANATSTGNARRGSTKQTPSQLLENAKKGIMPEDDESLETLILARKGLK